MPSFDVTIIGAGAAGLFCAGVAGQLGLSVLLIEHSGRIAEKIRISGGGRCNFTNRDLDPAAPHRHFLGENPHFCRSALARYLPHQFIELLDRYRITYHEKHKGQLFCDTSAEALIEMLLAECRQGGVTLWPSCAVKNIAFHDSGTSPAVVSSYEINSDNGTVESRALVIASGGLSIPKIGATDFGLRVARQFGLRIVAPRPALVPLTCQGPDWAPFAPLAGLSLPVRIHTGAGKARRDFAEDLLFTHRGLSGPAALQISSYWTPGAAIGIDLAPECAVGPALAQAKLRSRKLLVNELAAFLPARLAEAWVRQDAAWQRLLSEVSDKALGRLTEQIGRWQIVPEGTEGFRKAEVTAGGVDTRDLSSQTMESRQPGLYFIGEVVDVTGWLGGYNFQWAWASAFACAQALDSRLHGSRR